MFQNRLYYRVKPLLPWRLRMMMRRWVAVRTRARTGSVWPIKQGSEMKPASWQGWPGGKQFALVLTHDVESRHGVSNCESLMRLEMELGFRSSFNLVPEGDYNVPRPLRQDLARNGFEVGVHDLHHDGRLYSDREQFNEKAARINAYLKDWGAVGFRSAFMHRNLEWLLDLEIEYDASTFDTDPFEPQPDGVDTIYPFWVPESGKAGTDKTRRRGYVELPYTLPQDSTMFLLFREQTIDLWKSKVDWVAQHGGMVLLDTHPDYMGMNGAKRGWEYPVQFYREILEYMRSAYAGAYWHALPKEMARLVRERGVSAQPSAPVLRSFRGSIPLKPKIWIDLDNTPHVPFFDPIIDELKTRGYPLVVTARDAFQVCDLAKRKGVECIRIGHHYGKNQLLKGWGLVYRALQLSPTVLREKPALAVSHGARSQIMLANQLRIPTVLIEDYEHARFPWLTRPDWVIAPEVIVDDFLPQTHDHIRRYPGIKEDVYTWKLEPDPSVLTSLGIDDADIVVTVRPPATEAHYHNPESEHLFNRFMDRACQAPRTRIVLLPRNHKQAGLLRREQPSWFERERTIIPQDALDGLNLIWFSDLVVSGGGTMNREAAALGVPVYSIFRGAIGAVDRHLSQAGRLVLVTSLEDVGEKIQIEKRVRKPFREVASRSTLKHMVDLIAELAGQAERNGDR